MSGLSLNQRDPLPAAVAAQYSWAVVAVFVLASICYGVLPFTGPYFAALILLLGIVLAGLSWQRGPVLMMATLAVLTWNFFFIEPQFTLHISNPQDATMFGVFFAVALAMGHLTTRLREREAALRCHLHDRESLLTQKHNAKMAAEAERLHRTLLDSVSHEIKTPIAVIRAALDGLGTQNPFAQEIDVACSRLQRLVGNLLEITKVESQAVQPQPDWCELSDIIDSVSTDLARELQNHPLERKGIESLPLVKLDSRLLTQALFILVHNACQYSPVGKPIRLSAALDAGSSSLSVSVRDFGAGLPPGSEEKVFEKFYRCPGTPAGGTGLGLAIARGLVKALGGTVTASNHPEGGALFTMTLPVSTSSLISTSA